MSVKSVQGRDPMKDITMRPPKETTVIGVNLDGKSGASNIKK